MIFPFVLRILPGPTPVRVLLVLIVLVVFVAGLFLIGYPWFADHVLPAPDAAVDTAAAHRGAHPVGP
jgi:hypothetical protein